MFVIDGVAIYKRRNRAGGLYALEVIDAATIKLLLDDSGRLPASPDPAYQQIIKGVPAADYTREELMYLVHNPRSHKVYGYSHVEQVLVTVNILIRRALHQLEYYREGSSPDALVGLPREWTSDQIAAFQKHFDAMLSGNLGMRRHVRFMPGDFKYQETKAPPLKDAYDEFLARIICFVFSISPEPFVGQVNRATAESSHARARDEGLAPLMRFVRSLMNRIIISEFASPDLEFVWQDAREQDPAQAAQIDVAYVGAGILTVDEVRANMGLPPVASVKPLAPTVKKKIRKDAPGDDEDDGDDSGDEGESNDSSDNDDFDSAHPRWPAGSPGGIGGEFAPKDSGDATAALHDALASDAAQNTAPLNPNATWNALTSAIDKPSALPQGKDLVIDDSVSILAGPKSPGEELKEENESLSEKELEEEEKVAAPTIGIAAGNALNTPSTVEVSSPPASEEINPAQEGYDWKLGDFKSAQRWQNQMTSRGWTMEDINDAIENGEQFPAPNFINPGNSATRFINPTTGRYVVMDNITKEILQVGGDGYKSK
jgi:hypothetical protein